MKHLFRIFLALLTILSLAGCAADKGGAQPPDNPSGSPSGQPSAPSVPSVSDLLNASWPSDLVPAELPEYTSGTVTASGENGGVLTIKVKDTGESDLYVYLGTLQNEGWIVTSGGTEAEAVLGLYTVTFALQGADDTVLQIDVYAEEAGSWPADEIPPDVLAPGPRSRPCCAG